MRKILNTILLFAALGLMGSIVSSCDSDDNWDTYREWRETNLKWYNEQVYRVDADGNPYFTQLSPAFNPNSGVLIHYFNDRTLTEGNLSPEQTSTVKVIYHLSLYDGTPVDSSYNMTDSAYIARVAGLIEGWQVALNDMRVGDTCEVIIPYTQGYGASGTQSLKPYTTLKFNMRLVDIPAYEIPYD